jgi:hypothetical protein
MAKPTSPAVKRRNPAEGMAVTLTSAFTASIVDPWPEDIRNIERPAARNCGRSFRRLSARLRCEKL